MPDTFVIQPMYIDGSIGSAVEVGKIGALSTAVSRALRDAREHNATCELLEERVTALDITVELQDQ